MFRGRAIGAAGATVGEVVFNTSMTGYQEILTDPSYAGQIVTLTYPHIGNVGINAEDVEVEAHPRGGPRRSATCRALASNWRTQSDLAELSAQRATSSASPTSTRASSRACCATRARRTAASSRRRDLRRTRGGAMPSRARGRCRRWRAWTSRRSCRCTRAVRVDCRARGRSATGYRRCGEARFHVVAYDYGIKHNILRMLADARLPHHGRAGADAGARRAGDEARRRVPEQRPGRSRALRLRDRGDSRDRRHRHADVRHLPRASAARARGGRAHAQDEVRPSRRQPSGPRQGHGAGADHQPEPRVRGRSCVAARELPRDARVAVRRNPAGHSRTPTSRRSASRAIRKRARARTTSGTCSTAS